MSICTVAMFTVGKNQKMYKNIKKLLLVRKYTSAGTTVIKAQKSTIRVLTNCLEITTVYNLSHIPVGPNSNRETTLQRETNYQW